MKKKWQLHPKQYVIVDIQRRLVYFQHHFKYPLWRGITMNEEQFFNLHQIFLDYERLKSLHRIPLSMKTWFCNYKPIKSIENEECFFQFYRHSWRVYKRRVHHQIYSFLRHGLSRHESDKHHAPNESRLQHRARRTSHNLFRRNKTLLRTTGNVVHENEQWTESSNVSRRSDSDSGPHFSFRGAMDALRSETTIANDKEDGEVSNDEDGIEEYGSFCAIE